MDNLDWLIIKFLHQEKSAIRTAEKVHLSQPAIMYRLQKIESELNMTLFLRSSRGITFTSAGERLYAYADRMIQQYLNMRDYVCSNSAEIAGTIALGSTGSVTIRYLPSLLKRFKEIYPGISIRLHSGLSSELMEQLRRHEIYAAIIRGDFTWDESEYEILNEPIAIISTSPINFDELPYLPYIDYRADAALKEQISTWWKQKYGNIKPNSSIFVHDSASCVQFVMAGLGFSIIPTIRIPKEHLLFVEPIHDAGGHLITRRTRLLYRKNLETLDAYNAFITFMLTEFSNYDFTNS